MPILKSLYWKLTIAFVLVAFATAALVAVFIRFNSQDRLAQLIIDQQSSSIQQVLAEYYTTNGSWKGVGEVWQDIGRQTAPTPVSGVEQHLPPNRQQPNPRDRRSLFGLADAQGKVIVANDQNTPTGTLLSTGLLKASTPILVNGSPVGYLLISRQLPGFNPEEALFLQRTTNALVYAILGALVFALIIGIVLARTLTNPIKELTRAAQKITEGQLEQQVKVGSKDEIGQLAQAFNRMSQEVARVNTLRKQMTADIAHDLRTPLTVIGGYVEAMRDGVLLPTPQRLALIYAEIERLQDMVADLKMLSLVDAGELHLNMQQIAPKSLLERSAELFQHHAETQNVYMSVEVEDHVPEIQVDEARMMQVLDNLLSNALRYTPSDGKIILTAHQSDGLVRLAVQDTGIGIAPDELPFVFNRFHRADKSRNSEIGESGLGLAIVRALVEAQGGKVWAESELEKGTTIHIEFPVRVEALPG
jgi:signal transduction histidine kinase